MTILTGIIKIVVIRMRDGLRVTALTVPNHSTDQNLKGENGNNNRSATMKDWPTKRTWIECYECGHDIEVNGGHPDHTREINCPNCGTKHAYRVWFEDWSEFAQKDYFEVR